MVGEEMLPLIARDVYLGVKLANKQSQIYFRNATPVFSLFCIRYISIVVAPFAVKVWE